MTLQTKSVSITKMVTVTSVTDNKEKKMALNYYKNKIEKKFFI